MSTVGSQDGNATPMAELGDREKIHLATAEMGSLFGGNLAMKRWLLVRQKLDLGSVLTASGTECVAVVYINTSTSRFHGSSKKDKGLGTL